jgi:hypothetical protein
MFVYASCSAYNALERYEILEGRWKYQYSNLFKNNLDFVQYEISSDGWKFRGYINTDRNSLENFITLINSEENEIHEIFLKEDCENWIERTIFKNGEYYIGSIKNSERHG